MIAEMTSAEVVSVTQEQIAGMSDQELRDFRVGASLTKSRDAVAEEEARSSLGQRMLKGRKEELEGIRSEYRNIAVNGRSDSDIVRNLIWKQAGEQYILSDIIRIESSEKYTEGVDRVIEMCNDSITERELRARSSR